VGEKLKLFDDRWLLNRQSNLDEKLFLVAKYSGVCRVGKDLKK